jgi:Xaa-Pro dipeptidase
MNFTASRTRRVFQKIKDETLDAVFIKNSTEPHIDLSFFYFTGLESGVFEDSIFLAYPNGEGTLYTSRLEEESAKEGSSRFKTVVFEVSGDLERHLKEVGSNLDKIGVNSRELTYRDLLNLKRILPDVKIIDVSDALADARLVKDEEEISRLRRAAEITSRIWQTIPTILKEGITEGEVKAQICYQIQKDASTLAFEPIVSFGANTAEPHYQGGENRLKAGDFALFDFGARHRRYCADMTRTLVLGQASDEQKRMYEAVAEANLLGIESISAGAVAGEVHREVSSAIASKGFGGKFTHSTGHSIGLSVHDGAKINASSNLILEEGMVFTMEPGVYIPGFGGVRIEDDVVVCKGGCEILTSGGRELVEL